MLSLKRLGACFAVLVISACASTPKGEGEAQLPAWAQQPARTVDGGYIVFIGSGEDTTLERAHFKASGMAIQDLSNECSFAPKGTRSEDHFEQRVGNVYKSWAKFSVQYDDCESAKKAVDPAEIRKIANVPMADELKRYHEMMNEPEPMSLVSTETPAQSNSDNPSSSNSGSGGRVRFVALNNNNGFFWARQQIVYTKQIVILAPVNQYQPGSAQSAQIAHSLTPTQTAVRQYEAHNPDLRTGHQTYSSSPVRMQQLQARSVSRSVAHGNGARKAGKHEGHARRKFRRR